MTPRQVSAQQARALRQIAAMGDDATDLEGDLSICSRNWPATQAALVRRGLVVATHHPEGDPLLEAFYTYVLTDAGREAIACPHRDPWTEYDREVAV